MALRSLCLMLPVLVPLALPACCRGAAPPFATERLIDALAEVKQSDYGYSPRYSGNTFLPLYREGRFGGGLLGGPAPVRSEVLVALVRRGVRAVPHLLAHLDDARPTGIVVSHENSIGGMHLSEAADRNPRIQEPARVRGKPAAPFEPFGRTRSLRGSKYTVTVGDLCSVALGQIVNRQFSAVRYQQTAIIIVSSPTRSPTLRQQLRADWSGLTEQRHAASLLNDFLKPDHGERWVGAAERLAYYYPHYLEPLALALLARPTYSPEAVHALVRDQLYKTKDLARCRELLEEFVKKHGETAREGVMLALFGDLYRLEADEVGQLTPRLTEFKDQPRTLLIGLFGKDKKVRSSDCPRYPDALADTEKAYFIERAFIHDSSTTIDRAVLDVLRSWGDNYELAKTCLARLTGRGYDAEIERSCKRLKDLGVLTKLGYTRLHVAAEQGRDDLVHALLAKGASPAARGRNGKTPLHLAVERGYLDIVRLLAAARQGLDLADGEGQTAVDLALAADDDETARALVAAGCAVTDVRAAALANQPERAEQLLKEKPEALRRTAASKRTALHLAAQWGSDRTLAVLLRHGAEVDARDQAGATALHYAAWRGRLTTARLLLERKANVRAVITESNLQPVHLAAQAADQRMTDLLLKHGADLNAPVEAGSASLLHVAVTRDRPELLAFLLEKGATVDRPDEYGATPLHRAVEAGNAKLVRVLLRHRADANRPKGKDGPRPLHLAAEQGNEAVVTLLVRAGAKVDAREPGSGDTPLHMGVWAGRTAVVRVLLASKAAVNARERNGNTPLHRAARRGEVGLTAMLLEAGAAVRAANDEGWQPLHEASSAAVARKLLQSGADPSARATDGTTPLHVAAAAGKLKRAEVLLAGRAAVGVANAKGETPLHAAIKVSRSQVTRKVGDRKTITERGELAENATRMVSLLLEKRADINTADRTGATPLHRAAQADDVDLVRLLLSHRAGTGARDNKGRTPLAVAVALDNTRVVELLRRFTKD
jgi:ankyrin repeat protein